MIIDVQDDPACLFTEALNEAVATTSSKSAIDGAVNKYQKQTEENNKRLRAAGIDPDKITERAKKDAEIIITKIKASKANESSPKPVVEDLVKMVQQSFFETFINIYNDLFNSNNIAKEIETGLMLICIASVVNTLCFVIFSALLGPVIGMIAVGVFVAPLVEESARQYAIRQGYGLAAFTVFINVLEFSQYVTMMVRNGIKLGIAITIRATVAVFHQFVGALQKWGYQRDLADGVDPAEAGRVEFLLAIFLHMMNNAFAGVFWRFVFPSLAVKETTIIGDEVFFN